jgi:transposase
MRKIGEVLRLESLGLSRRRISQSVGVGKTAVGEYLRRAKAAGVSWPLPPELDEDALEAKLFPRLDEEQRQQRPMPDWLQIHRELKSRRHVTLLLLWLEYRESHPGGLGYSQFCWHYRRWLGLQDVVMRFEYRGGERGFVDYAGDTVAITDPASGETTPAQVFVAALGASGLLYAEASWGQTLPEWLGAHVHFFEYIGGVPEVLTPDNLKSGVTKPCWYGPELNPSYLDLARHFGTAILPTRVAKPRDKAAVEVGVQVVERWVLAPLRHRSFFSLRESNEAILERLEVVNHRQFRGEPTSRWDLFQELEKAALLPLPGTRFEPAEWRRERVGIDYHVKFDHHFYSVPYRLIGQEVDVRGTRAVVEIYHKRIRVASHVRERGPKRFITDPQHMPPSHRAYLEWTPERAAQWGAEAGPAVTKLAEQMLGERPHPEQVSRASLGLMRLEKEYGKDRLNTACARALLVGSPSYRSVLSILKAGLDRVPAQPQAVVVSAGQHENVRGGEYYREES